MPTALGGHVLTANAMKTLKRYDTPGHAHFLTFSCFERRSFLRSERALLWLSESVARACLKHDYRVWAYVFMPEHVHLLVKPEQPNYQISQFLYSIKKSVTNNAMNYLEAAGKPAAAWEPFWDTNPNGERIFRFWQRGGGYDRNICTPEELREKLEYIHKNPVARGLCDAPFQWRWSSASFYERGELGPVIVTCPDL